MGTFIGLYGDAIIREEKRDEFTGRMLRLFEQDGMLGHEQIEICGKQINLLTPLHPDKNGVIVFDYNIFEDDIWAPVCYDTTTNELYIGEVGDLQFCDVLCAAYILFELYSEEFCIAERNGMVFDGNRHIGWLNYLFDEQYTNARFEDPFRIYSLNPDTFRGQPLLPLVFAEDDKCVSHVGFRKYIDAYLSKHRSEQEWKEILREAEEDDLKRPPYPPVDRVSTVDFVGYRGLSDDDRVYFWKPDGDVHFSPAMTEWIGQLRAELLEIKVDLKHLLKGHDLIRVLVDLLDDADTTFERVMMFSETFYDLISHPGNPIRQAAVVLLQRLIEGGKAELPPPNPDRWRVWREKRFSPARLRIKQYLELLGNLELRKEVLGF